MTQLFAELRAWLLDVFTAHHTPLMAAIDDLTAIANKIVVDQHDLAQAVADLTARIAAQPAGATDAQLASVQTALEGVDGSLGSLTTAINGLVQPTA